MSNGLIWIIIFIPLTLGSSIWEIQQYRGPDIRFDQLIDTTIIAGFNGLAGLFLIFVLIWNLI